MVTHTDTFTRACMGGFCELRDACAHHHAVDRREPSERLCVRGQDGNLRIEVYPKGLQILALFRATHDQHIGAN